MSGWTLVVVDWDGRASRRLLFGGTGEPQPTLPAFERIVDLPSLKVHVNVLGRQTGMVRYQIWVRT